MSKSPHGEAPHEWGAVHGRADVQGLEFIPIGWEVESGRK